MKVLGFKKVRRRADARAIVGSILRQNIFER